MKTLFSRIGVASDGLGYSTQLSLSSIQLTPMSTKTLVVPGKYAYQVGDNVRIILAADTTKFITGKISTITESATDTTYTIYASAVSEFNMGAGYTGWNLSLAGINGVNGSPGVAGVGYPQLDLTGGSYSYLMQVGDITLTSVTSLNNTGYAVGTSVQLVGLDQFTYEPAAYGYGKITAISGSSITIAVDTVQGDMVNNFNAYTLNLSGATGSQGIQGETGLPANRNHIINGAFDIWQRGTSFTNPISASRCADRWQFGKNGTSVGTLSKEEFTPEELQPVSFGQAKSYLKYANTSLGSTTYIDIMQRMENVETLAGQTVTLSFWAKSNVTMTIQPITIQSFGSGGSTGTSQALSSVVLTNGWTRYSSTFTIPSNLGKTIGLNSWQGIYLRMGLLTDSFEVSFWGVQLEAGSVATPFQRHAPSLQGELAACQRYYWQATVDGTGDRLGVGYVENANNVYIYTQFPVEMRTSPTALLTSGVSTDYSLSVAGSLQVVSQNPTYHTATKWNATTTFTTSSSAMTPGQAVQARAGSANAYLAWSAEL
jgi:hypothetical protein